MRFTLLLALLLLSLPAHAEKVERPTISMSGANFRPLPLAIAAPLFANGEASRPAAKELEETLLQDLSVSGLFELLDKKSFLADAKEGVLASGIKFSRWQDVGAEALVKVMISGSDPVYAEFHLYSTVSAKEELKQTFNGPASDVRRLAHKFADEVFRFYTREPGCFGTRLAFVRKVKGVKQVFVGDWDGKNASPISAVSMTLLPSWTPDGKKVAFTSYRSGNPDLYLYDFASAKTEGLFHRPSTLITGASFSADGRKVVFSMSDEEGNSHLWLAAQDGNNAKKITEGNSINSSPSFSPDGRQIAFVSNRGGNPQIYLMPSEGGAAKRITWQGNYNQTPDWSPRGDLIAFTARDERNVFDLFTVDPASGKITRLTQDQGNNEEPSFSPNGRVMAFTSTRSGKSQLYVMSADGNSQRQMTFEEPVFTPAWGPFLPQ